MSPDLPPSGAAGARRSGTADARPSRSVSAPDPADPTVTFETPPAWLAPDCARLGESLRERGASAVYALYATDPRGEHGLWLAVFPKRRAEHPGVFETIEQVPLSLPVRVVVVGEDIPWTQLTALLRTGTDLIAPQRAGVVAHQPVEGRAMWVITALVIGFALPYAIASTYAEPGSTGRTVATAVTLLTEPLIGAGTIYWALGRRADGRPGRARVGLGTWVGAAVYGVVAVLLLVRTSR